jgi:hypothetical protein
MKAWILIAALAIAGPAFAVPPVAPSPAVTKTVQDFIRANTTNDLPAYRSLFSPDATVATGTGETMGKAQWIAAVSDEFFPARRTRFLNVFARYAFAAGKRGARVVFVEDVRLCRPNLIECFATFRIETITIMDGQIVALERSSDLTHQLTPGGDWNFSD